MTPPCPVALFVTEQTVYGTVYLPANRVAVAVCNLAGTSRLPEERLAFVRELGFRVAEPGGLPIPHPRAAA